MTLPWIGNAGQSRRRMLTSRMNDYVTTLLDALGLVIFNKMQHPGYTLSHPTYQGKPRRPIHPASPPSPSPTVHLRVLLRRPRCSRISPPSHILGPTLILHPPPNHLNLHPRALLQDRQCLARSAAFRVVPDRRLHCCCPCQFDDAVFRQATTRMPQLVDNQSRNLQSLADASKLQ